jgi:hypothetical protein
LLKGFDLPRQGLYLCKEEGMSKDRPETRTELAQIKSVFSA